MHTHLSHTLITILTFKPYIHQPSQENNHIAPCLAQHLAQAEGSRLGEEARVPSPGRELDFQHKDFARVLA